MESQKTLLNFDENFDINNSKVEEIKVEEPKKDNNSTQKLQEGLSDIVSKEKTNKEIKKILSWVLFGSLILIWIFCVLRVPYIGTFFDSVFFEFIFGWTKYIIYLISLVLILCIKIKPLKKIMFSKRKIIWYSLILLIISVLLSTIHFYTTPSNLVNYSDFYIGPNGYISNWDSFFWKKTVSNFSVSYGVNLSPQSSSWGGLIGLFIVSSIVFCSPILLIIILVLITSIFGLVLFYKHKKIKWIDNLRNKIIEKLGGFTQKEVRIKAEVKEENNIEEIKKVEENNYVPLDNNYLEIIKTNFDNLTSINNTLSLDNNEDYTNYDYVKKDLNRKLNKDINYKNIQKSNDLSVIYKFEYLKKIKNKINKFFEIHGIFCDFLSEEVKTQSIKLVYRISSFTDIKLIQNSTEQLSDLIHEEQAKQVQTYLDNNNDLIIEVVFKNSSVISLYEEYENKENISAINIPIGKNHEFESKYINLINENSLLVYGAKASGKGMCLSSVLCWVTSICKSSFLTIDIFDLEKPTLRTFSKLKNNYVNYFNDEYDLLRKLDETIKFIGDTKKLLLEKEFNNIYEFNATQLSVNIIKNKLIVINDIQNISQENKPKVYSRLIQILKYSKRLGIILIISSSLIDEDISKLEGYMNNILYFKLEEQSFEYLDNTQEPIKRLLGNGDMLFYNQLIYENLQSFKIQKTEIADILNINLE